MTMLNHHTALLGIGAALLLAAYLPTGSAVSCWTCASDLDPRCGDTFNTSIPRGGHGFSLINCDAPSSGGNSGYNQYHGNARSVCKKSKQMVANGGHAIIRTCAWQMSDQAVGACPESSSPSNVRVIFCETCDTDGCNSGPALGAPALPAIAALAALALLLRK